MKMVRINLICIAFVFVFTACSNKQRVETEYYPTGEIAVERIFVNKRDTSTYLETTFFLNGTKQTQGNYVQGKREGTWQGIYPTGELMWRVEYERGIVKPIIEDPNWIMMAFGGGTPKFQAGKPQKIRIFIEGVEPEYYAIGYRNATVEMPTEDNDFWYVITPQEEGNMLLEIGFVCKESREIYGEPLFVELGSDTIYVYPADE